MTNVAFAALSRQTAIARELDSIANNVANASTSGYRRDAFIFSEFVKALDARPSMSQTRVGGRLLDMANGEMTNTGSPLDVAIAGPGFFRIETPTGALLTRAGAFSLNAEGVLVAHDGSPVGGEGGAEIVVPADAGPLSIAEDGTISADGAPLGRIEIVNADPTTLSRAGDTRFRPAGEFEPVANPRMRQGFIEASNVNPVLEIARLIEVQRSFEIGQQVLADENDRARRAIESLGGQR
jgi:flagellar basal-body rod protein FlgF